MPPYLLRAILFELIGLLVACSPLLDPSKPGNLVPGTVDDDASLPSLEINGTKLHVQTYGDSSHPIIIFLHGGPGGDHRGLLRLKELQDQYFLVFWDQRGAGLSRRHAASDISLEGYLDDLHSLINHFTDEQVILIGHSWGGAYATYYISNHPTRVRQAVLIEPGPFTTERYQTMDLNADYSLSDEWLNDLFYTQEFLSPDDHERYDYNYLVPVLRAEELADDPMLSWRLGAVVVNNLLGPPQDPSEVRDFDFSLGLDVFDTDVMFMRGSNSKRFPESDMRIQMADFPNAHLVTIQDAEHDLVWSHADEVVLAIREYLNP